MIDGEFKFGEPQGAAKVANDAAPSTPKDAGADAEISTCDGIQIESLADCITSGCNKDACAASLDAANDCEVEDFIAGVAAHTTHTMASIVAELCGAKDNDDNDNNSKSNSNSNSNSNGNGNGDGDGDGDSNGDGDGNGDSKNNNKNIKETNAATSDHNGGSDNCNSQQLDAMDVCVKSTCADKSCGQVDSLFGNCRVSMSIMLSVY